MISALGTAELDGKVYAAGLYEAARKLVPGIRGSARKMELARRLDDDLVEEMRVAGMFSVIVPKRWGGAGLGPVELNKIIEIIGTGDCSTAWVCAFYNLHHWFLCRFPLEVQQQLFAGGASVPCAAVWAPIGTTERVAGGYRVSGRWGYATGILHATHALLPASVGEEIWWFIVPRDKLQVFDDWDMASMAATGSVSIAAKNVFVADGWGLAISRLMSATDHYGLIHPEDVYKYPFSTLVMAAPSLALGALETAVDLARERLSTSKPLGVARIDRSASRIRWVNAYQAARVMRLVRDATTDEAIRLARSGRASASEDEALLQLHHVSFSHGVKDALRLLVDGNGSSGYRSDDLIRRISGDVAMLATHALGTDYDVVMDRHARWILGRGVEPGDPQLRIS